MDVKEQGKIILSRQYIWMTKLGKATVVRQQVEKIRIVFKRKTDTVKCL